MSNRTEQADESIYDESIYGVKPNWVGMALGLVTFLGVTSAMKAFFGKLTMPNAHELPLFLAPMISCGVAYAVFFDAVMRIKSDPKFNLLNMACALLTTVFGVFLTVSHRWYTHLLLMGLMFIVFILWDMFVIKKSSAPKEYKAEVETAHKSINLPTLGALMFLTFLLLYMHWSGLFAKPVAVDGHDVSLLDLVTTGAVAFHLGVASLAYVCAVTPLGIALIGERTP